MSRETWKLEVITDPENPAKLGRELTKADGTALDFAGLLDLGEKHAVRFAKVMTCLNIGCPLGMGIWEGVPLREVFGLTRPREDVRRVFYYGYHNDDPKQMFKSSLPLGRVLEDHYDLPPVILCYKLNGQWLDSKRGGPVRVVVPEAYGFKSIKWLSHVVLTNLAHANDTYASGNNDVDSPLKTFAATLSVPDKAAAGQPMPVTGYAQVGISGLSKVQVWITSRGRSGRPRTSTLRPRRGPMPRSSARRASGAATCRTAKSPPARSASMRQAGRRPGRCAWAKSTGRRCCPACPPASTPSAAARSTRRASPSRCRGPSASRATRRLRR